MRKAQFCLFSLLLSVTAYSASSYASSIYAPSVSLTPDWLEPMLISDGDKWDANLLNAMEGLYDCGEIPQTEYCSEPVRYYNTLVDSFVWVENNRVSAIEIQARFTPIIYSELQLNLRKDGFALAKVQIGDQQIDVIEALKNKEHYLVDREVIMFMNRGAITTPRVLTWFAKDEYQSQEQTRYAEFRSDGKTVVIKFIRP